MSVISLHIQVSLNIQCIENFKYSLSSYPIRCLMSDRFHFIKTVTYPCMPQTGVCPIHKVVAQSPLKNNNEKRIKFWHLSSLNYYIFMKTCLSFCKKIYWTQSILSQALQGFFPQQLPVSLCFSQAAVTWKDRTRVPICGEVGTWVKQWGLGIWIIWVLI